MTDVSQILNALNTSPSVDLLRLRSRELIIQFFVTTFVNKQAAVSSENIHNQLVDFLEEHNIETDEEHEVTSVETYEQKAKRNILFWTNKGFLTNYSDEQGEIFYELSVHSSRVIDWLLSLKKEEFVGTESKFNTILNQLKELVEFTNEDVEKRIEILEERKLEIEQQIQRIKSGDDVKVFEAFEIVPVGNGSAFRADCYSQ